MSSFTSRTYPTLVLCLVWLLTNISVAPALDLYIAPDGNDQWSGKLVRPNSDHDDGPLATLAGARDAIRKLKQRGPLAEPIKVIVAEGRYNLTAPFELSPEDTGTKQAPIYYKAADGARPIFSGGRIIRGWQPGTNGIWQTHLPEVAAGRWYFEQLWVNGHRAVRARTPNKFSFYMRDVQEDLLPAGSGKEAQQTVQLFPDDFRMLAGLAPAEIKDVNMVVYQNWDVTRCFLAGLDDQTKSLIARGPRLHPGNPWVKGSRFICENARRFLDSPGEWFLSRDGTLFYQPLPGEEMAKAEVIAPVVDKFIVIKGEAAANKFVQHLTFKGLTFQNAQWVMPPNGFEPAQAAVTIDAAVMVDGARQIMFDDCEFSHLGTYGIWFRGGCRDDVIRHCVIEDFGAGGVRIGEMAMPAGARTATSHVTVDNNIIRHGGYIFPCAVGVWIGFSPDNQITHNEIADLFYTGISVGWRWGYAASNAKRNNISFNRVHHMGQWLLSDLGGIYTLGPSAGTVVRGNQFYDIYSYAYGGWGLYADEGSSGLLFENNLVYDTKSGGFHQHYGRENIVRNNIFADGLKHQLQLTSVEDHLSFTFENNIVYWTNNSPALAGPWDENRQLTRSNCYWNAGGYPFTFAGNSLAQWQHIPVLTPVETNGVISNPAWAVKGRERGSIIADPLFVDAAQNNFRLRSASPAFQAGFRPFDFSQAGVYGEAAWRARSQSVVYPPATIPPPPPFIGLHTDFERDVIGKPPKYFEIAIDESKDDSILVTDEKAATGRHSVKITDAHGLKELWLPHFCAQLNCPEGWLQNTFALWIEPGANVNFEWRDWSKSQYQTGPQFRLNAGTLQAGGKVLTAVPYHQWLRFEISAGIGTLDTGKWSLKIIIPNQTPREFKNLPLASSKFKMFTWVGFTSDADEKNIFYLDDFILDTIKPPAK